MARYGKAASAKVEKVMKERNQGTLRFALATLQSQPGHAALCPGHPSLLSSHYEIGKSLATRFI